MLFIVEMAIEAFANRNVGKVNPADICTEFEPIWNGTCSMCGHKQKTHAKAKA
jgi:hypothetical protein